MKNILGFTLIELMIVVAFLGILVAMIVPVLSGNPISLQYLNGTICKQVGNQRIYFNRDMNGFEQQVVGTNGFPVECTN